MKRHDNNLCDYKLEGLWETFYTAYQSIFNVVNADLSIKLHFCNVNGLIRSELITHRKCLIQATPYTDNLNINIYFCPHPCVDFHSIE